MITHHRSDSEFLTMARRGLLALTAAGTITVGTSAAQARDLPYRSFAACPQAANQPKLPSRLVRLLVARMGYRLTGQPVAVNRRIQAQGRQYCGFWRAEGARGNERFALYYAFNGRPLYQRKLEAARLNPNQLRAKLRQQGYRRIQDIRLVRVGNRQAYTAKARRRGETFQVFADPASGNVFRARPAADFLSEKEVRQAIAKAGFSDVENLLRGRHQGRDVYTARAVRDGKLHAVMINARNGRVMRTRVLGDAWISERDMRRALRRAGYRDIDDLRRRALQGRQVYTAHANKGGKRYRVIANARNGKVLRAHEIAGGALSERDMRRGLRQAGYRDIDDLKRIRRNRQVFWQAEASKGGKRYRLLARASDGRILRAHEIAGSQVSERDMRRILRRAGYRQIRELEQVRRNGQEYWRAEATKGGKRFRILARASDGRVVRAREMAAPALTRNQVAQALNRQGWSDITNVRRGRHNGDVVWLAEASRNGRDYKLILRARDGRVLQATAQALNAQQIRLALRRQGYRRIRDLEQMRRRGQRFYRASARKGGQRFRLLARAEDGRVVRARPDQAQLLNEQQIERRVARAGYRNIRVLRQSGAAGQPAYLVRAEQGRRIWLLVVDATNGKITNRRKLRDLRANAGQVSVALSRAGYAHVGDVKFVDRGGQSFYQAEGWKDGSHWRVRLNPEASRMLSRRRIGGRLSERAVERRLARAGYRDIEVLRWRPNDKAGAYLAVGWQGRSKYRLRVSAADGKVAGRRKIDEQQVPVEVIRRLARLGGFHHMDDLAWLGGQGAYRGVAWRNGYRWRIWVRARDGRILRRDRLGGRVTDAAVKQRLTAAGFTDISDLRFVDNRREGYFVAVAQRGDEKFRVFARAADGRAVRTVLLSRRLSKKAITQRILAAGYERTEDLDLERDKDGDYYTAFAWKNGRKYRLKVRASDGDIYWRTLLEPRARTVNIEDLLFGFGYDRNERIRFVEDAAGGHFEVIAWRSGRRYRLYLRAHDGSIYRRVSLGR